METADQRLDFICPTFSTTDESAAVAARVADEAYLDVGDSDFEFDIVKTELSLGDAFPVFDLSIEDREHADDGDSSASEEEEEELEGVLPGTYCMWRPRKGEEDRVKKSGSTGSGSKRWKLLDLLRRSNSEGKGGFVFLAPKSKPRENGEGSVVFSAPKDGDAAKSRIDSKGNIVFSGDAAKSEIVAEGDLVFLRPMDGDVDKSGVDSKGNFVFSAPMAGNAEGSTVRVKAKAKVSVAAEFYARNRASEEGQKRKSYLPYRRDLIGFFTNVKQMGKF